MTKRLRVFISSPGDVRDAREAVAQTVEKIGQDYLRHFELEPYMWETEVLLASGHFQDAIEPPSQFDVVALILWSRLGTALPERTAVRTYVGLDGRSPVTGTEWEFEDALRASREHGAPDLLVYRSRKAAQVDAWNAARRQEELEQLAALDRFWSRNFADRGSFIGAYYEFGELEDLAETFDSHLRQLLDRRVAGLSASVGLEHQAPRIWPKSPFRGLAAFDFEHAPIYFGRAEAVGKALTQLIGRAKSGPAFLLVSGASGSGKSSLAKAGLVPRLSLPRRVVSKSFVRRASFRPGERREGEDVFDALARILTAKAGAGAGLPELGKPDRVARTLREAPQQAAHVFDLALDGLTAEGVARGRLLNHEQAALVLVIDQLEELFTDQTISADQRIAFISLLGGLAAGGRVWVIATLRSDLWHRAAETPELIALAEGAGRFDLLPPRPAEIRQMITLPAEAAGLTFESDPVSGVALNDDILEAAAQSPAVLPLLSYLLEQLYQADVIEGGRAALSYASYVRLGGLKGAIAARAEAVLASQPRAEQAALRPVLFSLVRINGDTGVGVTMTARRAPLAAFPKGSPGRQLIEAFLEPGARLLVADDVDGGGAAVRVAHEALLSEWVRAREMIAEDGMLLTIRRSLEERHARWRGAADAKSGAPRRWLLADPRLLSGIDLDEARRLVAERGTELIGDLRRFIDLSLAQDARRRQMTLIGWSMAGAILAGLAVSGVALIYSKSSQAEVQQLDRTLVDVENDGDEAATNRNYAAAVTAYGQQIAIAERLVSLQPNEPQWRLNLATGHARLARVLLKRGDPADTARQLSEFKQSWSEASDLAKRDGASPGVRKDRISLQTQLQMLAPYFGQ